MKIVVIPSDKQPEVLNYAAEELEKYLNMLPSGTVPAGFTVCLSVDGSMEDYGLPHPEDDGLDDQYVYEISREGGRIAGINARSVLLGVYAYLYGIGIRFLRPGCMYEYVPADMDPKDLEQISAHAYPYRHRGVCLEGACSVENILDFIEWLPKLGFNSFFVQFQLPYAFMERWYRHENNPAGTPEAFDVELANRHSLRIDEAMRLRGLIHHRVGHGWTCETAGYPSDGWKEWDKSGSSDMLAMLNGERKLFHGVPLNTNLCYSSPEVVELFAGKVASYAASHREVDYLHVWLADAFNNICECEECQKSLPADQYIHILNVIDEKLQEAGLDTRIVFLIYQELLWPPRKERLRCPDRFTLMFAPISRRFMSSYPDSLPETCIGPYERNHIVMPADIQENLSYLKAWREVFPGDSFDYDYPLGRAHYGDFGYVGIAHILYDDIAALEKLGLNGYMSCQQLRTFFPNALPDYVMGLALSGSQLECSDIVEDYFSHAYGSGCGEVMDYLDSLSRLSDWDYFNRKGDRISERVRLSMTEVVNRTAEFGPVLKSHRPQGRLQEEFYKVLDYHREYCRRLAEAVLLLSGNEPEGAWNAWEDWKAYIGGKEEEFQSWLDVYRVIEVTGNFTGFKNIKTFGKNRLGDYNDISKQI